MTRAQELALEKSTIAQEVRALRTAAGMTQTEFAFMLEVKPLTVARWEAGLFRMSKGLLERARYLCSDATLYCAAKEEYRRLSPRQKPGPKCHARRWLSDARQ